MKTMIQLGKTLVAIAVSAFVGTFLAACGGHDSDAPSVSTEEARITTLLDKREWRFIQDDNLSDAAALSADTAAWSRVQLPHTWNAIDAATTEQTTPTSQN